MKTFPFTSEDLSKSAIATFCDKSIINRHYDIGSLLDPKGRSIGLTVRVIEDDVDALIAKGYSTTNKRFTAEILPKRNGRFFGPTTKAVRADSMIELEKEIARRVLKYVKKFE